MGMFVTVAGVAASVLLWVSGPRWLFVAAAVATICHWIAFLVMARHVPPHRLGDWLTQRELDAIPDWPRLVDIPATIAIVVLLPIAIHEPGMPLWRVPLGCALVTLIAWLIVGPVARAFLPRTFPGTSSGPSPEGRDLRR